MDKGSASTLLRLLQHQPVAALGTLRKGEPVVTMVLFAAASDLTEFYIHTSRIAIHTQNFLKHDRVSLMVCESPESHDNPQTLARVSISGTVVELPQTDEKYEVARTVYLEKYPASAFNFQLGDFALYRIVPLSGRFVAGFAQTFNITPDDLTELLKA